MFGGGEEGLAPHGVSPLVGFGDDWIGCGTLPRFLSVCEVLSSSFFPAVLFFFSRRHCSFNSCHWHGFSFFLAFVI